MHFWFRNATWLIACTYCCAGLAANTSAQEHVLHDLSDDTHIMGDQSPEYFAPECGTTSDETECDPAWEGGEVLIDRGWCRAFFDALRFRSSNRHGRASGHGQPLRGTSWLNRPYSFGLETGGFVMTKSVSSNNSRNNDVLLAAQLGWDFDDYWGTQFRVAWTTPEFYSTVPSTSTPSNNLLLYDLSLLYYPWGDSRVRPYYRFGVGLTDIDFITPFGVREDNTLFTTPVGLGIKYQTRRWVALRAEAMNYIAWGQNSARGMQNFTLTFGLEWRYGGRPDNNWTSPNRHGPW